MEGYWEQGTDPIPTIKSVFREAAKTIMEDVTRRERSIVKARDSFPNVLGYSKNVTWLCDGRLIIAYIEEPESIESDEPIILPKND